MGNEMKPGVSDYRILKLEGMYFVLTPFDLFAMPAMKIVGNGYSTLSDAKLALEKTFERDFHEYKRLEARGRSFPDND